MVLFYKSKVDDADIIIYAGKDKFENEDLIKYALENDVWFHVDKLSSPHIYLRLPMDMSWERIPESLLVDCAQLVKAGSIQGNKQNNLTIIYTPAKNLKKTNDMEVGQVSFYKEREVKRVYVAARDNAIVNRLNKTKQEVAVNHEADLVARKKAESAAKKAHIESLRRAEKELRDQREKEKKERSYDSLFSPEAMRQAQDSKSAEDDDDFFM